MNDSAITPAQQARMIELVKQLAPTEGYTRSVLDPVMLMRANRPLSRTPALYEPSIVIVLQGRKRGMHGGHEYVYDARHYLVLAVPLPFFTETEGSEDEPMLGVVVRIDPAAVAELATGLDEAVASTPPAPLFATPIESKLGDATLRLLEALSDPAEARLLGPSILREITFRALTGSQGGTLRAALLPGGHFSRIANVLRRIHAQYDRPLDVATLAGDAHMSVPAFHSHFKAITTTSPIQYIKAIRLHEARLMMIRRGLNASTASQQVGYESPSQFSREFKRLFGRSPTDEVKHLREILALSPPVGAPLDAA